MDKFSVCHRLIDHNPYTSFYRMNHLIFLLNNITNSLGGCLRIENLLRISGLWPDFPLRRYIFNEYSPHHEKIDLKSAFPRYDRHGWRKYREWHKCRFCRSNKPVGSYSRTTSWLADCIKGFFIYIPMLMNMGGVSRYSLDFSGNKFTIFQTHQ